MRSDDIDKIKEDVSWLRTQVSLGIIVFSIAIGFIIFMLLEIADKLEIKFW